MPINYERRVIAEHSILIRNLVFDDIENRTGRRPNFRTHEGIAKDIKSNKELPSYWLEDVEAYMRWRTTLINWLEKQAELKNDESKDILEKHKMVLQKDVENLDIFKERFK